MTDAQASPSFARVLRADELPPGGKKAVQVGGSCVLLCHVSPRIYAISNTCSHNQQALDGGKVMGTSIACPLHGARFDLATGKALNLPAKKPVPVYEVRVVDGWIEVQA
jgi:3-phenylpropionate/trans-cinnamate dioxygenase ferredoxin subunit